MNKKGLSQSVDKSEELFTLWALTKEWNMLFKATVQMRTAECQDGVSSPDGPEHARLFETRADYCLATKMLSTAFWM